LTLSTTPSAHFDAFRRCRPFRRHILTLSTISSALPSAVDHFVGTPVCCRPLRRHTQTRLPVGLHFSCEKKQEERRAERRKERTLRRRLHDEIRKVKQALNDQRVAEPPRPVTPIALTCHEDPPPTDHHHPGAIRRLADVPGHHTEGIRPIDDRSYVVWRAPQPTSPPCTPQPCDQRVYQQQQHKPQLRHSSYTSNWVRSAGRPRTGQYYRPILHQPQTGPANQQGFSSRRRPENTYRRHDPLPQQHNQQATRPVISSQRDERGTLIRNVRENLEQAGLLNFYRAPRATVAQFRIPNRRSRSDAPPRLNVSIASHHHREHPPGCLLSPEIQPIPSPQELNSSDQRTSTPSPIGTPRDQSVASQSTIPDRRNSSLPTILDGTRQATHNPLPPSELTITNRVTRRLVPPSNRQSLRQRLVALFGEETQPIPDNDNSFALSIFCNDDLE